MIKVCALPLEKIAVHVVVRTTLNLNARIGQEGPVTQGKGQMEAEKIDACTSVICMKFMKMSVMKAAQLRT